MKLKSLILGVAAGMIFSVTASFGQTTIVLTLMNPSFESPTVGSGGYTFSTPNWGGLVFLMEMQKMQSLTQQPLIHCRLAQMLGKFMQTVAGLAFFSFSHLAIRL